MFKNKASPIDCLYVWVFELISDWVSISKDFDELEWLEFL